MVTQCTQSIIITEYKKKGKKEKICFNWNKNKPILSKKKFPQKSQNGMLPRFFFIDWR